MLARGDSSSVAREQISSRLVRVALGRPLSLLSPREFFIDKHCTTNDMFARFVEDSGYVTEAEKFGWSFALE